ncbi:Omega-6 fatty acid desaturase, chloroplastic [Ananas comosus]|uniref:Omega-6 fatty acid desaturase, chloroplastic n=1 Tax=Ananas comosus TaxID=4615 RepID=A0A199UPG5_ANACO|nr:Omega-6 fatty acid desaturase, chloroplastic [Ananas comosus]
MDSLPKKVWLASAVFEIDDLKAWKSVLISVTSYALGIFVNCKSSWYLLPWLGHGLAQHDRVSLPSPSLSSVRGMHWLFLLYSMLFHFFVIGHDCAHKNKLVEDIVGTLAFLPLIYPYEPWRFKHDRHHAKTNMMAVNYFEDRDSRMVQVLVHAVDGMSTFTMIHHTAPHIPFKASEEWNAAQAQLGGTVHCNYPRWIEILCHDISVHIPHHISPRIPSYNLRAAHEALLQNWGKYLNEANWNWRLMKTIMTTCHVYDKEKYYVSFDEVAPEDSKPITFLKKAMPDYA